MMLLNDAKGVKLIEAGGGWFFKVTQTEVKFFQTDTTKHDGKPVAVGTVSKEQMGILFNFIFPPVQVFFGESIAKTIAALPSDGDVIRPYIPDGQDRINQVHEELGLTNAGGSPFGLGDGVVIDNDQMGGNTYVTVATTKGKGKKNANK